MLHEFYTLDFKKAQEYLQAFVDAHNVGPTHEVFALMARIQEAQDAEDARKAAEAAKKRQEEERLKLNEEL